DVKATSGFRKFLTFLVFVLVASLFWFILALNDDIQDDFEVGIKVVNVPDSVTFIQEIPKEIHVLVRDKGTSLWRNAMFTRPEVEFNFREYASDGLFYVSRGELTSEVKKKFGQSANVISVSLDTIGVIYTTLPPRRVPVEVNMDITPAMGKVISSKPVVEPGGVQIYSSREGLDTITRVVTDKLRAQNLEEPTTFTVKLKKIPGVRIEPSEVKVRVNVEALIRRQITLPI
ncbi:MAG: YbbR-like domain-containing protein, partial [Muribaculaceae bacterium]|nr:YbbR-like domain-containing protein [Muribaculaceae bacterium]